MFCLKKTIALFLTAAILAGTPLPAQAAANRIDAIRSPAYAQGLWVNPMDTMFSSQGFLYVTTTGGISKIDQTTLNIVGTIPVPITAGDTASSILDEVNGFAYFLYSFGTVIKVNLANFQQEDSLVLSTKSGLNAAIDVPGGFAYFTSFTSPQATICKVRLSDFKEVAKLKTATGLNAYNLRVDPVQRRLYVMISGVSGGMRVERINLDTFTLDSFLQIPGGLTNFSSQIDVAGGMLYIVEVGGVVRKVRLSDFTAAGSVSLGVVARTSALDAANGFLYVPSYKVGEGKVIKVRLSDLGVAGSLVFSSSAGQDYLNTAAINTAEGFAFFGSVAPTRNRSLITRVRLSNFTEAGFARMPIALGFISDGVIDRANDQIIYVTQTGSPNQNYLNLTKVGISNFAFRDFFTIPEDAAFSAGAYDVAGGFAYLAYNDRLGTVGKIVKVRISDFQVVKTITLAANEIRMGKAIIDVAGGYAYFCNNAFGNTLGGKVVRIRLSDFSRVDALTVSTSLTSFSSAVLDKANGVAYFSYSGSSSSGTVRVGLSDFQIKATFPYTPTASSRLDSVRGVLYCPNYTGGKPVIDKVNLANFTVLGTTQFSNQGQLNSVDYDPVSGILYAGTYRSFTTPAQLSRINPTTMAVIDVASLATDENKPIQMLIDSAGKTGYAVTQGPTITNQAGLLETVMKIVKFNADGSAPPPTNTAPVPNAGEDKTITLPATANLLGAVSDDGLPNPPAAVTTTWQKQSGPGTVSFTNANALTTTASFSTAGTYKLRLNASDGTLNAFDEVTITVKPVAAPVNQIPNVNAGPNQSIVLHNLANLVGTATDDGLPNPPAALTIDWEKISGPGTVTFGNAAAPVTTASFTAAGTYVLRLSASDGSLIDTDDISIVVQAVPSGPVNQSPDVNAGPNKSVTMPAAVNLQGTATDDGLPNGSILNVLWTVLGGPGTVTFNNEHSAATTATFSAPGSYVLRLSASDSILTDTDDVTVTVNSPANGAPAVSAGANQSVVFPSQANLVGNASDDGLPNPPAELFVTWSQVSGPGEAEFAGPNSLATAVSFPVPGVYVLRLSVSDGQAEESDEITITVTAPTLPPSNPTENEGNSGNGRNVFNPSQGQSALIPCDGQSVEIFTINGNLVTTLPCSNNLASWDGNGAASSLYLARIGSRTRKIVLVK